MLGSVGNRGEEQGPPSTAKNAISVAAASIDATGEHFGNGVSGPTADKRHKPDVMAPGCDVRSAQRDTPCDTGEFHGDSGCESSWAAPRAAGLAALVRQYFTEGWYPAGPQPENAMIPSGALIKAILVSAARPLASAPDQPWPSDVSAGGCSTRTWRWRRQAGRGRSPSGISVTPAGRRPGECVVVGSGCRPGRRN